MVASGSLLLIDAPHEYPCDPSKYNTPMPVPAPDSVRAEVMSARRSTECRAGFVRETMVKDKGLHLSFMG